MSTEPKVHMRGLAKAFDGRAILRDFDLRIMNQDVAVVVGQSGSGKSVMLKCLLGLIIPDAGEIMVNGTNVLSLHGRKRDAFNSRIGMLFQHGALFDSLNIWENIAFGLIQGRGMHRQKARNIAMQKLSQVGLAEHTAEQFPPELSGGMQKRAALARAIACDPEIILFDEPTTGLDPVLCHVIDNLIVKCATETKATSLVITHDMGSVQRIATSVNMLYQGRNIWNGTVPQMASSNNPYMRQFFEGATEGPLQPKSATPS